LVEDVFDERDNPPSLSPHNPQHILEQTDSEEKEDDDPSSLAMDVELDDDEEDDLEEEEEDTEAELGMTSLSVYPKTKTSVAHLSKDWSSPVYVFFRWTPRIEYKKERQCHVFECAVENCKAQTGRDVRRFLDTSDAKSTRNMRKHAKVCWGAETVTAADATKCLASVREVLAKAKLKDGSITAEFVRIGKGKVTYSHRQHTKMEAR
jgi:hypothetical protein